MHYFRVMPAAALLSLFFCYTPKLSFFAFPLADISLPAEKKNVYLSQNIEQGKKLILSDDSVYEIAPDDQEKAAFWITPIEMKITPSSDPDYPYLIHNSLTDTSVKARLATPPK